MASTSSGQCWSLTTYCPVPGPVPTSPANNGYKPGFAAALMLKDLKLAQEAALASGAATPLGAEAAQLYALFNAPDTRATISPASSISCAAAAPDREHRRLSPRARAVSSRARLRLVRGDLLREMGVPAAPRARGGHPRAAAVSPWTIDQMLEIKGFGLLQETYSFQRPRPLGSCLDVTLPPRLPARPMARLPLSSTADPAADAAALLRRLGFAILVLGVPVTALVARRAVVVMAPLGIVLLILAAAIDGGARPLRESLGHVTVTTAGLAGGLVLLWCGLSIIWTPFPAEASERLLNILGSVLMALAGYLALPERMRSANLYLLPVGVALAAFGAMVLALVGKSDEDSQNLERGLIVLAVLLWPAMGWLRSRGRHLESMGLALVVALATILGPQALPLQALAVGAVVFGIAAANPRFGAKLTAGAMAGLLVFAPLIPFVLLPLVALVLGEADPVVASLDAWRQVVLDEPVRLITGHGFETALRSRLVGYLPRRRRTRCCSNLVRTRHHRGLGQRGGAGGQRPQGRARSPAPGARNPGRLRDRLRVRVLRHRDGAGLVPDHARRDRADLRCRGTGAVPHHTPEGDPEAARVGTSHPQVVDVVILGRAKRDPRISGR